MKHLNTDFTPHNTHSPRAQPYPPSSQETVPERLCPKTPTLPELNHIHHSASKQLRTAFGPLHPLSKSSTMSTIQPQRSSKTALHHNTLSLRTQPYPPFNHKAAQDQLRPITSSLPELNHIHQPAMKQLYSLCPIIPIALAKKDGWMADMVQLWESGCYGSKPLCKCFLAGWWIWLSLGRWGVLGQSLC